MIASQHVRGTLAKDDQMFLDFFFFFLVCGLGVGAWGREKGTLESGKDGIRRLTSSFKVGGALALGEGPHGAVVCLWTREKKKGTRMIC